jgi:hypothetical protein
VVKKYFGPSMNGKKCFQGFVPAASLVRCALVRVAKLPLVVRQEARNASDELAPEHLPCIQRSYQWMPKQPNCKSGQPEHLDECQTGTTVVLGSCMTGVAFQLTFGRPTTFRRRRQSPHRDNKCVSKMPESRRCISDEVTRTTDQVPPAWKRAEKILGSDERYESRMLEKRRATRCRMGGFAISARPALSSQGALIQWNIRGNQAMA